VFAGIALGANLLSFFSHRIWYRLLAGIAGPLMVLATLYLFWTDNWSTYLFYAGLTMMLAVSIWDIVWVANSNFARKNRQLAADLAPAGSLPYPVGGEFIIIS